jgi:hypothetical protein
MSKGTNVREWLYRAASFETDAERFRSAGIKIGAGTADEHGQSLEDMLSPFGVEIRSDAMKMSRFHALIFCFENSVRDLVAQTLEDRIGDQWWQNVAPAIQQHAQRIYDKAVSSAWLEGNKARMIDFVTFGQLKKIIIDNWPHFQHLIPTQHWMGQKFDEIEDVRNYVAHSRLVSERELGRLILYIEDWNKQVGI